MSKYCSADEWKTSDDFISTDSTDSAIKERKENISIIAGPGTGKTEVLAQRASFLLQSNVCNYPQKILALTFKVDAAKNIKDRINMRCGRELAHRFDSSTFDAFFISIVQRFLSLIQGQIPGGNTMPADFKVLGFNPGIWRAYEHEKLRRDSFPYKKHPMKYAPLDLSQLTSDEDATKFWQYCIDNKIVDYNMCRSMALTIINNNKQIKNLILSTYKHLFLDEFQDANDPQYSLVKSVFHGSGTIITAVGDTNQGIMTWAGAKPAVFNDFQEDFHSKTITLEYNHRSNKKVVGLINYIIKQLTLEGEKAVEYKSTSIETPSSLCLGIKEFNCAISEAEHICKCIRVIMGGNTKLKPNDFCLILRQQGKEYVSKVVNNFKENDLMLRHEDKQITPQGIKVQDLMAEPIANLIILLIKQKESLLSCVDKQELHTTIASLHGWDLERGKDSRKLDDFINDLVFDLDFHKDLVNAVSHILKEIKSPIKNLYSQYRSDNLNNVIDSFRVFFQERLDENGTDIKKAIEDYYGANQVKLMTIHKSKGLEFDTVFFVDFHDQSWWGLKGAHEHNQEEKLKEERNAFFVGLSRAKNHLYFTKHRGNWPPIIAQELSESNLLVLMPDIDKLSKDDF
ncbi:MAG: ATP-dependent helicase [Gammaproteobacteria bacterium]|nr:ATP-dependent helicase [Gammaproteobacteria bacterium]